MGKSDLIDKINARVKSQMNSLSARTSSRQRAREKEERASGRAEKRITNARTGKVVVRRRAQRVARPETEEATGRATAAPGTEAAPQEAAAPRTVVRRRPREAADEAPVPPTTQAPVEEAPAEQPAPTPERAPLEAEAKQEPEAPPVEEKPTEEAEVSSKAEEQAPDRTEPAEKEEPAAQVEAVAEEQKPAPTPAAAEEKPIEVVPEQPEEEKAAAPAEAPEPVAEQKEQVEKAPEPPKAAEAPEEKPAEAAEEKPAEPEAKKKRPSAPQPRSIEDVLERELGPLVQQRRAVVVGDAPVPLPGTSTARAGGRRSKGGTTPKRATPQTPEEIKRVANEDRKREKGVVKVASRGRVGAPDDRVGRGARPRKGFKRKEIIHKRDVGVDGESTFRRQRRVIARREKASTQLTTPKAIKRIIKVEEAISVGELAHRMGVKAAAVIKKLMGLGVMANISQSLDVDTASLVASEFGYEVENVAFDETALIDNEPIDPEKCEPRPPVVTVMGHVDHGKTTLLDAIRHTDVASAEAGGITQHIGAYTVNLDNGRVVFLDTPGHEAFTAMRARGAQATDIVVLVVAADDGVMPQTEEAINHAKAAGVPIIVAINKIDKPGAEPDRIKNELAKHDLVSEEWGGDTLFAEVSAKEGTGVKDLLDLILLQAEMLELVADPNRPARGIVIESQLDKGRGPVATVIVQQGTLKRGDVVVVGTEYGRVRAMTDDRGKLIKEAPPSTPVEIQGLSGVPNAGDDLAAVADLDAAKKIVEFRRERARQEQLAKTSKVTLEDLYSQLQKHEVVELKIVLKADVQGSIEAMRKAIGELSTDKVKTVILHAAVGTISEGDVTLASASNAIVLGFNVGVDAKASAVAEQEGVQINTYTVIYEAIDDIKKAMKGLLKPVLKERITGHAEVRETFSIPKIGLIAGSSVVDGKINRGSMARVLRDGQVMWEGRLVSLRRFKDDVREVEKGYECGIALDSFNDVQLGDVIEVFTIEETQPSL